MAKLQFPNNPINGQIYPNPALQGAAQWQWNAFEKLWKEIPLYVRIDQASFNSYNWPAGSGSSGQQLTTTTNGVLIWGDTILTALGVLEAFDGTRKDFTITRFGDPVPVTLTYPENIIVFLGGVPQIPGASNAFTIKNNKTISFTEAPQANSTFYALSSSPVTPATGRRVKSKQR